ncbi:HD domain-containing protein [Streptomyces sp. TRM 70351]|uniref:HD domain-containing protein n=1 Tax=Streptomyces sp. TRM 70351 TaxID=3116552 RepID=UPI002E7AFB7A|nr:HD domain-containing protein [Streptomyces sp. TRM 70351]MEE1927362.1 HD domain-containing protein [Streptomyces sp. TRM 70351]
MPVLTAHDARLLHERHAPDPLALALVHTHCEIVARIARQLAERSPVPVDTELVETGALVHDIGVYRLKGAAYIRHGIEGYALLRAEGLPEEVCRFASRHTGVGLTRDDIRRQGLPLPPRDYVAETAEERLVMYADKFHSKSSPPRFVDAAAYAAHVARFGTGKAAAFAALTEEFGEPGLAPLIIEYGHAHETAADTTQP